jgi:hypothetical protein
MTKNISVEDFVTLQNLVGKYQWLVDGGDSEGWAALWTEDGVFSGGATQPFAGHEALKQVPAWVRSGWNGALRHHAGSLYAEYGATTDEAIVRYYNLVTTWNEAQPKLFTFAVSEMRLVRRAGQWKIASNTITSLAPPRELGATE